MKTGRPLDAAGAAVMVVLCASWGLNQSAIKVALVDIPPLIQGALRSILALPIVVLVARLRGVRLAACDGSLVAGVFAGALFGFEFVFIYYGSDFTTASRAIIFIYTGPLFTALGARFVLGEWLSSLQWAGLGLAFAGVVLAVGVPGPVDSAATLKGDALLIVAGLFWGATSLTLKGTVLATVPTEKLSIYQYTVSAVIFAAGVPLAGESMTHVPGNLALYSLAYQSLWVLSITYTIWFAFVVHYSASRLSAFSFLTPLFGVVDGHLIMGDPLTPAFLVAVGFVLAGLVLVNRR